MRKNNILVTSTDFIILNTLLYLYNRLKEPVTIPDIEKEIGIRYTTIRYSINKFKKFGLLKEEKIERRNTVVTGYIPKTNSVLVLDKNYLIVVLEDIIIPLHVPSIDFTQYIGKIIPLDQAPDDIKLVVNQIYEDLEALTEYGMILKEDYLNILFQQYLEQRKALYS